MWKKDEKASIMMTGGKMKRVVYLLLMICLFTVVTACDGVDKSTDAYRFKEEYESINGEDNGNGKKYRVLNILDKNPIVYASSEEIVEKMNKKESFVVYFGFAECPWCRSMIEQLLESAKDHEIDTIYYVDISEIRDQYRMDEEGTPQKTNAGTEGYRNLIEKMENVLSDYTLKDDEGNEISVGEKRIYAPNVVAVVNGNAEKMVEGISEKLEDPYSELTKKKKKKSYNSFNCLWECINNDANMCQKNMC